jgi:hypothetical protein
MNSLSKRLRKRICRIELYAAAAAGIISAEILFMGPVTGVANNGDYNRVVYPAGLEFITDSRYTNIDRYFRFAQSGNPSGRSFNTSLFIPVEAAKLLNRLIKSSTIFDIVFLGISFTVLFMIGIYLLVKGQKTGKKGLDLLLSVMLLLFLCDVGYVSYFNSFLGEAAIFVYLLLMSGVVSWMLGRRKITIPWIICFFISSVLFISAKQANVLMGIFIAGFGLTILLVDRRPKIIISICASTLLLAGVSIYLYISVPESMDQITKHQTVFYGILKNSPTPEQDLEFLGLDGKLTVLKEASFYDTGLPIASHSTLLENTFYNKISFFKVLKFYLYHPDRFIKKLEVTAKNSTMIRTPYLGNFLFEDTHERFNFSREFSLWSTFKKTYFPNSLGFIAAFFLLYLLVLLFEYYKAFKRTGDGYAVLKTNMFVLLWTIGVSQFFIPILGDGEVDLEKHMFLYNLCFDLMLISAVIWIVNGITKAMGILKSRISVKTIARWLKLSAGLFLITLLFSISNTFSKTTEAAADGRQLISSVSGTGTYLRFGRYGGEDLLWQVIDNDNGRIMLIADKIICFREFDTREESSRNMERKEFGSNDWETSDIRTWLNSDNETIQYKRAPEAAAEVWQMQGSYNAVPGFLYGFTKQEKDMIGTVPHKSILSIYDLHKKEGGSSYYLWTNCISLLMQNFERAYCQTVSDRVFLPDVREMKECVFDNGLKYRKKALSQAAQKIGISSRQYVNYWLRTPYAARASFVRTIGSDGYVYYKDANCSNMGVLPVLCLKPGCVAAGGDGSFDDPFRLGFSASDAG